MIFWSAGSSLRFWGMYLFFSAFQTFSVRVLDLALTPFHKGLRKESRKAVCEVNPAAAYMERRLSPAKTRSYVLRTLAFISGSYDQTPTFFLGSVLVNSTPFGSV